MDQEREDNNLHKLLNAPKVPQNLADKLKANLEAQIAQSQPSTKQNLRSAIRWYALAATVALAALGVWHFQPHQNLVSLAYAHSVEEAQLTGAQDGGYESWLKTAGLRIPAEANHIVLSKDCVLGQQHAKHLRFDLPESGTINLFVYQESGDLSKLTQSDGAIDGQAWMALSPRTDLHLLALYDTGVDKAKLAKIIESLFKEQTA